MLSLTQIVILMKQLQNVAPLAPRTLRFVSPVLLLPLLLLLWTLAHPFLPSSTMALALFSR